MNRLKRSRFVQFFYKLPGVASTYHFLWAWTSARIHKHPSRKIFVIGVTGTKGKTTTLELLNAILETAGKRTALLSSLRVKIGPESQKNTIGNSMPGRGFVQKFLRRARDAKCSYALIEVTSQAVVQHRHKFVEWNMGVLTNLAPEHIEAHGSFENYRDAKLSFLQYVVEQGGKIFLNRDDRNFDFFSNALIEHEPIQFSKDDESLRDYLPRIAAVRAKTGLARFDLNDFNTENIAVAVAIAKELGIPVQNIEEALANFAGVPGRMEYIKVGPYTGIVDYAHTPDSLRAAYIAARPKPDPYHPNPRLICVLGAAGGGRDVWKRPAMGAIAAEHCDEIVITNEDPYDEDPNKIIDEVAGGVFGVNPSAQNVHKILDRRAALAAAASFMREGDVVIATGKGSEDWIHIRNGNKLPWNEREMLEEALKGKV